MSFENILTTDLRKRLNTDDSLDISDWTGRYPYEKLDLTGLFKHDLNVQVNILVLYVLFSLGMLAISSTKLPPNKHLLTCIFMLLNRNP